MATEMTPQERADLNMIAYNLVLQINEITPVQWDKHDEMDRAIVLAALQATRRAALLEAREVVLAEVLEDIPDNEADEAYNLAIGHAAHALDRLAQEG